jgi:hypothetical protein
MRTRQVRKQLAREHNLPFYPILHELDASGLNHE